MPLHGLRDRARELARIDHDHAIRTRISAFGKSLERRASVQRERRRNFRMNPGAVRCHDLTARTPTGTRCRARTRLNPRRNAERTDGRPRTIPASMRSVP